MRVVRESFCRGSSCERVELCEIKSRKNIEAFWRRIASKAPYIPNCFWWRQRLHLRSGCTNGALKGHGFSRAAKAAKNRRALAPEERFPLPRQFMQPVLETCPP